MKLHLTKPGTKLRVKDGLFEVRHFDKNERLQKEQFAPSQVKSIWLYYATTLSTAVLDLAQKHNVDVVFTDKYGHPIGRFHPHRPHSTSKVQRAQMALYHTSHRFRFVCEWVSEKIQAQITFLHKLRSRRPEAIRQFLDGRISILKELSKATLSLQEAPDNEFASKIRGIEGAAGRTFFHSLNHLLLPRYQFENRSRRPAKDAFNAFLNYGFALLYARVERSLVLAGVNPYLGFLHRDGYQYKSMVFDFIEPFRTGTVDVVFRLFSREKVSLSRHAIERDGGIFLTNEGKRLLIKSIEKYYTSTRIKWEGLKITLENWIERRAQQFAGEMLGLAKVEV